MLLVAPPPNNAVWGISTCQLKLYLVCWKLPDYLRKIIVQGRSSKSTKVGDIMTEEVWCLYKSTRWLYWVVYRLHNHAWWLQNKLITVTHDTKVLKAMQLMTGTMYKLRTVGCYCFLVYWLLSQMKDVIKLGTCNEWQIDALGTFLWLMIREWLAWYLLEMLFELWWVSTGRSWTVWMHTYKEVIETRCWWWCWWQT